jgi:hypothetical protein
MQKKIAVDERLVPDEQVEDGVEKTKPLVPPEQVDDLAQIYTDFDRGFRRTKSRTALDGGVMLLAILQELRSIKALLERADERSPGAPIFRTGKDHEKHLAAMRSVVER